MLTLTVEGWLHYAQSHSIVNQFQCLELLKRDDVGLFHGEAPQPPTSLLKVGNWKPSAGLLSDEKEKTLASIPKPPVETSTDVTYRLAFPFDFSRSSSRHTCVFAVAEGRQLHSYMIDGKRSLAESLEGGVEIITPSSFSRDRLIASGAPPASVEVVPHGIDPAIFYPVENTERDRLRETQRFAPDVFVFLNVGALYGRKGIPILLRAFAQIAPRYKQARMMLKGIDTVYGSRAALSRIHGSLSDAERVAIKGRVTYRGAELSYDKLADLYRSADVLVSPYQLEGFNMPVLEAMACGLPVICTAGGPTDEFTREDFAWRIKSRMVETEDNSERLLPDVDHLVHLMEKALVDDGFRRNAREIGAPFAAANYSWARVTDRLLDVLRSG